MLRSTLTIESLYDLVTTGLIDSRIVIKGEAHGHPFWYKETKANILPEYPRHSDIYIRWYSTGSEWNFVDIVTKYGNT